MSRSVKVLDLHTAAKRGISAHLYCPKCHGTYSAHPGDYWMMHPDEVFKCCRVNNILVTKTTLVTKVSL